ncbi:hypothetical protein [Halobacteriovorax sp.]|uniref:hypothetical protein n=1 Tax=Halobacteriovorax sp. TaxID=2020862 RepID=UPI00356A1982
MKVIPLFLVLMNPVFADVVEYTLQSSDTTNCPTHLVLEDNLNQVELSLNSDMGAYFNKDSSEGNLIIENINEGTQVVRSTNSSHGTKSKTKYTANRENNIISVTKEIKYGTFGSEKSESELVLEFKESKLTIDFSRSYKETFVTSWETSNNCIYNEIK